MYNSKLTQGELVNGKPNIKPPYRRIFDENNNLICGMNKNSICDLNGQVIATASSVDTVTNDKGKKTKIKKYSSGLGEFSVKGGEVSLNGSVIGGTSTAWVVPFALITATATVVSLALVTMLMVRPWVPSSKKPVIDIGDGNGAWSQVVEMLPDTIYPGGEGQYEFVLTNPHDDPMTYSFDIQEVYNGMAVEDFPMEFRMMKNGEPITDYWFSAEELEQFRFTVKQQETYDCGIQWRWLFESGDDERDTKYGQENGTYALDITIYNEAQVYGNVD